MSTPIPSNERKALLPPPLTATAALIPKSRLIHITTPQGAVWLAETVFRIEHADGFIENGLAYLGQIRNCGTVVEFRQQGDWEQLLQPVEMLRMVYGNNYALN